jgi:tRNA A-37 threonylcarbamoyl transferase component Bud32
MFKKPGLSIIVDESQRKEKKPGLSIDVGTPESRIGTPISSIGSDNDFGNSPIRTFSFPYTELLNKEISTSPTDLYSEIKKNGKVLNDKPHSRLFRVDGLQGGIIFKMKAYKYPKGNYPKGNLLLKEYMYITSMSLDSPIVKLYEEKFFKEIYLQMITKEIEEECEVSIPSIIEFGKFEEYNKGDLENYFYIIMDFIEGENPVNLEKCEELKTKVKAINKCLKSKDIYHNDLNSGNVIINDGTITLIDFGEATETEGHARPGDNLFNCEKKVKKKPEQKKGGKKTRTKKKSGKKTRTKKNRTKRQKR